MGKRKKTNIEKFIGQKVKYDNWGQMIFGQPKTGGDELILNVLDVSEDTEEVLSVRGWGAISHLFGNEDDAMKFQDELGQFYADAINEKLERLRNHKED